MSRFDKATIKRRTWIVLSGVLVSGLLMYIVFLFAPCGLATNLLSSDCILTMNLIFPPVYGGFALAFLLCQWRAINKMIEFPLPAISREGVTILAQGLPEEMLVLAGNSREKVISPPNAIWAGIPGAILSEIALQGGIVLDGKRLSLAVDFKTSDALLDAVVQTIRHASNPKDVLFWLDQLNLSYPSLSRYVLERMGGGGDFATREEALWLRIEDFCKGTGTPDARTAVLVALAGACGLMKRKFVRSRNDRTAALDKARQILATRCPGVAIIIKELELLIARAEAG
jgi:hypothetical protein